MICLSYVVLDVISGQLFSLQYYDLFILDGNGTADDRGNGTGTIGNNGSQFLYLSWTSVNISPWYNTFHLVPVLVPIPYSVDMSIELEILNVFDKCV